MEFSLRDSCGLPYGSVMCIRASGLTKQKVVRRGECFKFPAATDERIRPLKVEVLHQVGSAYTVLAPGDGEYELVFDEKGQTGCKIGVTRPENMNNAAAAPVDNAATAGNGGNGPATSEYLEKHEVPSFLQSVLQTVLLAKPEDPYAFMARMFVQHHQLPGNARSSAPLSGPTRANYVLGSRRMLEGLTTEYMAMSEWTWTPNLRRAAVLRFKSNEPKLTIEDCGTPLVSTDGLPTGLQGLQAEKLLPVRDALSLLQRAGLAAVEDVDSLCRGISSFMSAPGPYRDFIEGLTTSYMASCAWCYTPDMWLPIFLDAKKLAFSNSKIAHMKPEQAVKMRAAEEENTRRENEVLDALPDRLAEEGSEVHYFFIKEGWSVEAEFVKLPGRAIRADFCDLNVTLRNDGEDDRTFIHNFMYRCDGRDKEVPKNAFCVRQGPGCLKASFSAQDVDEIREALVPEERATVYLKVSPGQRSQMLNSARRKCLPKFIVAQFKAHKEIQMMGEDLSLWKPRYSGEGENSLFSSRSFFEEDNTNATNEPAAATRAEATEAAATPAASTLAAVTSAARSLMPATWGAPTPPAATRGAATRGIATQGATTQEAEVTLPLAETTLPRAALPEPLQNAPKRELKVFGLAARTLQGVGITEVPDVAELLIKIVAALPSEVVPEAEANIQFGRALAGFCTTSLWPYYILAVRRTKVSSSLLEQSLSSQKTWFERNFGAPRRSDGLRGGSGASSLFAGALVPAWRKHAKIKVVAPKEAILRKHVPSQRATRSVRGAMVISRPKVSGPRTPGPSSVLTLHLGGFGCGAGVAAWNKIFAEHRLGSDGRPTGDQALGSTSVFFQATKSGSFVPRAVFADVDKAGLEGARTAGCFDGTSLVEGSGGFGGNWGDAYMQSGLKLADNVVESLRVQLEFCDRLDGLLLTNSLSGATGGGLSARVLELVERELGKGAREKIFSFALSPFHVGDDAKDTCQGGVNAVLTAAHLQRLGHVVLFDVNRLSRVASSPFGLNIKNPTLADYSDVVGHYITGCTSPMRFGGASVDPLEGARPWSISGLSNALTCYPAFRLHLPGMWPLMPEEMDTHGMDAHADPIRASLNQGQLHSASLEGKAVLSAAVSCRGMHMPAAWTGIRSLSRRRWGSSFTIPIGVYASSHAGPSPTRPEVTCLLTHTATKEFITCWQSGAANQGNEGDDDLATSLEDLAEVVKAYDEAATPIEEDNEDD